LIRPAREADLAAIPAIEASAVRLFAEMGLPLPDDGATEPPEHWRPALEARTLWVAVDEDDAPVGYAACVSYGDILYVQQVDVHRDHQQRGLGRTLMTTAIEAARRLGKKAVALTTFRRLPFNAPFYASLGFVETAEPPPWLAEILADEARRGMSDRCAMMLGLVARAP
jgi:GNAT superfamily N-acetyltransferase